MGVSRRRFVRAAAAAAVGSRFYGLADALAAPARLADAPAHFPEQHIIQDLHVVTSEGVIIFEPPRYSEVVTARLHVEPASKTLAEARAELEHRMQLLDDRYPSTPGGLAAMVAYGLPYFERFVPSQWQRNEPRDLRATSANGRPVGALAPAERFPSDPHGLLLEANDIAVLLRSDSPERMADGYATLFPGADFLEVTSRRKGFAGGGYNGGPGLPKLMATAAGIRGAGSIPHGAELFLGFTSTPKEKSGRERIVNLETLGYVDLGPSGYFRHGTHMHLSHLYEDLEAWYGRSSHAGRVASMFRPGLKVAEGKQTLAEGPAQTESATEVVHDAHHHGLVGHIGSIQPASRLQHAVVGPDGVHYGVGTPIAHRADFNTLDRPFAFSSDPSTGRHEDRRSSRAPLRRLQPDERRLPPQPSGDGRAASRRADPSDRSQIAPHGDQPRDPCHAPAELPRAAADPPLLSALRASRLTGRKTRCASARKHMSRTDSWASAKCDALRSSTCPRLSYRGNVAICRGSGVAWRADVAVSFHPRLTSEAVPDPA